MITSLLEGTLGLNDYQLVRRNSVFGFSWLFGSLTFIVQHLNSVFVLRVQNILRDGPLNRCACLTMYVYKLYPEGDEIMK
jgi:hypothetical protein